MIRTIQALFNLLFFVFKDIKKIQRANIIFILPYYQTGGAERIHLSIVNSVADKNVCILFTHNSATLNFKNEFAKRGSLIEINKILTKKNQLINRILLKLIYKSVNKNENLHSIFSSNTNFFYNLIPHLKDTIIKVDLIHAISKENPTLEKHYINSGESIDFRVVINSKAREDLLLLYKQFKIDKKTQEKIIKVENAIDIFPHRRLKNRDNIKIGFIGRWSKEKRPEIVLKISQEIKKQYPFVQFVMAGIGMKSNISKINKAGIDFLGEITDVKKLSEFYNSLSFLLITSYREGFPVVIMEAMSYGVVPVTTEVGGINEHINNNQNGILVESYENEDIIVSSFVKELSKLINEKEEFTRISRNAFHYSKKHFNLNVFNEKYREILLAN